MHPRLPAGAGESAHRVRVIFTQAWKNGNWGCVMLPLEHLTECVAFQSCLCAHEVVLVAWRSELLRELVEVVRWAPRGVAWSLGWSQDVRFS